MKQCSGSHCSEYENYCLLGHDAVYSDRKELMLRNNLLPSLSLKMEAADSIEMLVPLH
jgi:hypothetical protein